MLLNSLIKSKLAFNLHEPRTNEITTIFQQNRVYRKYEFFIFLASFYSNTGNDTSLPQNNHSLLYLLASKHDLLVLNGFLCHLFAVLMPYSEGTQGSSFDLGISGFPLNLTVVTHLKKLTLYFCIIIT